MAAPGPSPHPHPSPYTLGCVPAALSAVNCLHAWLRLDPDAGGSLCLSPGEMAAMSPPTTTTLIRLLARWGVLQPATAPQPPPHSYAALKGRVMNACSTPCYSLLRPLCAHTHPLQPATAGPVYHAQHHLLLPRCLPLPPPPPPSRLAGSCHCLLAAACPCYSLQHRLLPCPCSSTPPDLTLPAPATA